MDVMVGVSSRHGATTEIARRIASRLRAGGHSADVFRLDERPPIDAFDAFVIGSAIYMGQWRRSARRFVDRHHDELRGRPVFLFSSGPLDPDDVGIDERRVDWLTTVLGALDHRVFAGALDRSKLDTAERIVVRLVDAEAGDHRPWDEIDAWADEIAERLHRTALASSTHIRSSAHETSHEITRETTDETVLETTDETVLETGRENGRLRREGSGS